MKQHPKILTLSTYDYAGGAAKAAYRIQQGVRAAGLSCQMLVKERSSQEPDVFAVQDVVPIPSWLKPINWAWNKVENRYYKYQWKQYPKRLPYYMSDLRAPSIHKALQKFDYDVLHLHWINQRFFPLSELQKIGNPIVWTLHDSWAFCGICHYFLDCDGYKHSCGNCPYLYSSDAHDLSHRVWQKKKEYYRDLDLHIVTPSRWLADCARQSSLFRDVDVRVIPNCLDTDVFTPLVDNQIVASSRNLQKRVAKPFVLYGAVNAATDRRKGFANLLCALKLLENNGFYDFELVVFGAKDEDLQPAREQLKHINIRNVGYINDTQELVSLYQQADVMVVPSLTENLSCTIMESLACGTPVVAFNIGGNADMITHKVDGWLAPGEASMAEGIRWALTELDKRALQPALREKILARYSMEQVAKQYVDLYKSLV